MTFRFFSHTAKPSSASGGVAETLAMGDGEGEEEGLKKELIFACIAYRIGIVLRVCFAPFPLLLRFWRHRNFIFPPREITLSNQLIELRGDSIYKTEYWFWTILMLENL